MVTTSRIVLILWAVFAGLGSRPAAAALSARDLLIVYNLDLPASKEVAIYYAEKRQVPLDHLLGLSLPTEESISRQDYESKLAAPLAERVRSAKQSGLTPALLLVYGVPLKVGGITKKSDPHLSELASRKVADLAPQVAHGTARLNRLTRFSGSPEPSESAPVAEIIRAAAQTIAALPERQKKIPADSPPLGNELALALMQQTGITPIAKELYARQTSELGPRKLEAKPDSLLTWSVLLEQELLAIQFRGVSSANAEAIAAQIRLSYGLLGELRFWHDLAENPPDKESSAAVDSELSLLLSEPFAKRRWLPNPFLPQFDQLGSIASIRGEALMVGRLDGPTPAIAKRLVDDALAVEEKGLEGTFYIDARGLEVKGPDDAYAIYDEHLRKLRDLLAAKSKMPVVFDNTPALFPKGSSPQAALYCGWYSLANYVDAFTWVPGSVGYHVASAEATTLHKPESNVWCKQMLDRGIAATLGPVEEPYLESFPRPDLFFPLLMSGKLPLLEVYYRTTPYLSWRQIVIGDPLYTPFRNHPMIDTEVEKE